MTYEELIGEDGNADEVTRCVWETEDGICELYSYDEVRQPCVEGPCVWYFEEDDGGAAEDITKEAVNMAVEALEAQKVKHGKWILQDHYPVCNKCKGRALRDDIGMAILSEYCPACGAKMDGKEKTDG